MTTVLIVDDNPMDRRVASSLLEDADTQTVFAEHGREAVAIIDKQSPDLVVTDLQMPEMDGLSLVEHIRANHPRIPVVLMTAFGSEEIAAKALQAGAASYVPKQILQDELRGTVQSVLSVTRKRETRALVSMTHIESRFVLGARLTEIDDLIAHFQEGLKQMNLCDEADLIRVGTALHEALVNANEHGNLELDSALRDDESGAYHRLADERAKQSPFRDRRVHVRAIFTRADATFHIRDEGPGFDAATLPDPTDPENLDKVSGRGLFLIRTFMDEVEFNTKGNEIRMVKRRLR